MREKQSNVVPAVAVLSGWHIHDDQAEGARHLPGQQMVTSLAAVGAFSTSHSAAPELAFSRRLGNET